MKRSKGFTLVELMIVVIIIGILSAIAFPQFLAQIEKARKGEAITTMSSVRKAEQAYYAVNGSYATSFPITADIDDDGTDDVVMAEPSSPNFTYSITAATSETAYIQAARTSDTGSRMSYGVCIQSGKEKECAADTCVPVCP